MILSLMILLVGVNAPDARMGYSTLDSAVAQFISNDTIHGFDYDAWKSRFGYMIDSGLFHGRIYYSTDVTQYIDGVKVRSVDLKKRKDIPFKKFCMMEDDTRVRAVFDGSDSLWVVRLDYFAAGKKIGGEKSCKKFAFIDSVLVCKRNSYFVYYRPYYSRERNRGICGIQNRNP